MSFWAPLPTDLSSWKPSTDAKNFFGVRLFLSLIILLGAVAGAVLLIARSQTLPLIYTQGADGRVMLGKPVPYNGLPTPDIAKAVIEDSLLLLFARTEKGMIPRPTPDKAPNTDIQPKKEEGQAARDKESAYLADAYIERLIINKVNEAYSSLDKDYQKTGYIQRLHVEGIKFRVVKPRLIQASIKARLSIHNMNSYSSSQLFLEGVWLRYEPREFNATGWRLVGLKNSNEFVYNMDKMKEELRSGQVPQDLPNPPEENNLLPKPKEENKP
jgi:hypothetical protein